MKYSRIFSVVVLCLAGLFTSPAGAQTRPNVVIILADDMGFSDASCYGGEINTPNLDALAKNGLRFTQFYNTARCWPSRGALLTGYYAQSIRRDAVPGVKSGNPGQRPNWAQLLPEMLKANGYRAYHSGKWHVDGKPLNNGFDHSYALNDHDRYFAPDAHTEDDKPLPAIKAGTGYYSTTYIADHAIKCLKEHAGQHAKDPFFTFIAFTSPHFPIQAPPEDIAKYKDRYIKGWDALREERFARMQTLGLGVSNLSAIEREVGPPYAFPAAIKALGPGEVNRPLPWNELTEAQRDFQSKKMPIHAAMVDRMDQEIGKVVAQLKAMNAYENTIILFLSDNGASAEMMVRGDGHDLNAPMGSNGTFLSIGPGWSSLANTPFRRHKTWVHEGGISTPLIVQWPAGIKANNDLRHTPGHIVDIVPTILEVTGSKQITAPELHGKSLVPLFTKDGTVKHDSIWWLHEENRALRIGDWKIVAAKGGPWELYNLSTDRAESKNLADEQPAKVKEMVANWTAQHEKYNAMALKDAPATELKPGKAAKGK